MASLRSRDKLKVDLERLLVSLRRLVVEQDVSGVQDCLIKLKALFDKLEDCHYSYVDESDNDEEISAAEIWFSDTLNSYLDQINKAKKWMKSISADTIMQVTGLASSSNTSIASQVSVSSEIATALSLPKLSLKTFSGSDVSKYQAFATMFDEVVGSKVADDRTKLSHLLNHLEGEAYTAVETCSYMAASVGYNRAREILSQRYGDRHVIAQNVIHDLRDGKRVSTPGEVRQLSDKLFMAKHTLQSMGASQEIDNHMFIRDVVNRCDNEMIRGWSTLALNRKEMRGTYPVFDDLCEYVSKQAARLNDPFYGKINKMPERNVERKVRANNVQTSGGQRPAGQSTQVECLACPGKHETSECRVFEALTFKDRHDLIRDKRACFRCMKLKHFIRNCTSEIVCSISGCGRAHHRLLHDDRPSGNASSDGPRWRRSGEGRNGQSAEGPQVRSNACNAINAGRVHLPVVQALVNGRRVSCLLDNGSSSTLMTRRAAQELGISGDKVTCNVDTVNQSRLWVTELVHVSIQAVQGTEAYSLRNVLLVDDIPAEAPNKDIDLNQYEHLRDIPLEFYEHDAKVDLLIGLDHPELLIPYEVRSSLHRSSAPYAVRSPLGWTLNGPFGGKNRVLQGVNNVNVRDLRSNLESLWEIEHDDEGLNSKSVEDERVEALWDAEISHADGHYMLPIPWRDNIPNMPNNRALAEKRLEGTERKLHKIGQFDEYKAGIEKMLTEGYAETVPVSQLKGEYGKVWYLPHHGVYHPAKRKLRIVFDCAAKFQGVSLNNQCLQGPDLVNKLTHVLLRFRRYEKAFMCDVRAMYLQTRIPIKDRDCLRFLWREGGQIREYRMTSHLFGGVWCASSSTYALRRVLRDYSSVESVQDAIRHAMYVDDLLGSFPTVAGGREVAVGCRTVLAKAGYDLTKYVSNDPQVLEDLPEDALVHEERVLTPQTQDKALGIQWNVQGDYFEYQRPEVQDSKVTKRSILSAVSMMYDPLGLLSPVTIVGRLIFQDATRLKTDWDDGVSIPVQEAWTEWRNDLASLGDVRFPRCVIPTEMMGGAIELHHFGDASERAYGACSYLRVVGAEGTIKVSLLMAKSRVAPVKIATIPRLELCAATLAVQLDTTIRRELHVDLLQSYFWCDSKITLAYIANENRRFKVFVGNRVSFIRRHTSVHQWNFVPTDQNPADILSRGCRPGLVPNMWINGPEYLMRSKDLWPVWDSESTSIDCDPEVKREVNLVKESTLGAVMILKLLTERFDTWYALRKAVAWLRRFVVWLKSKRTTQFDACVTAFELDGAQISIFKCVQGVTYRRDIQQLEDKGKVSRSSELLSLNPIMVKGMLRVGGRLKHSQLDHDAKFPLILPAEHPVTTLLVRQYHERHHFGTEWTASLIRSKFWIPKLRKMLKKVRKNCVTCVKNYDNPVVQKMADLPEDRCTQTERPFERIGTDVFGPFLVKQGRSLVKRYGCIFTCLVSRAIHLEVLHTMDSDSFINALVRLCARRGAVVFVRSDNGSNFVGSATELSRELQKLDRGQVIRGARRLGIEWVFNPPHASHYGGVWERMIRTVRRVLTVVLNPNHAISDEVLLTSMIEAEGVVNSRPLTKLSEDPDDYSPLTPNHLLLAHDNASWPWSNVVTGDLYRKRWKAVQTMVSMFWSRWMKEYLPQLQRRSKWKHGKTELSPGDLVLVVDINVPRGMWPLARITSVVRDSEDRVRKATIKTKLTTLTRPVTKLVKLELD